MWAGPCGSDEAPPKLVQCKKVLAAWAMGAGPFTYPEEAGLEIGGPEFNQFVLLEVHYNNQAMEKGVKDESGMRFYLTENLRPNDAGIMELGLVYTDRMAIPPGQDKFPLSGHCLPECTAVGFPPSGITIFGSQLHTHGAGVQVETKHFRDGEELPELNRDNHYSTHFQEIRLLHKPRHILPGDELVTTCWYDTRSRENATVGGFGFAEEMCLNYVHYFPRTEALEICKSSVDTDELKAYFGDLKSFENQPMDDSEEATPTQNYHAIDWTPKRASDLYVFYQTSLLSMQCQSGQGGPLPGKWTGMQHVTHDISNEKKEPSETHHNILELNPRERKNTIRLGKSQIEDTRDEMSPNEIGHFLPAGGVLLKRNISKKRRLIRVAKRIGRPMNEMKRNPGNDDKERFARVIELLSARKRKSSGSFFTSDGNDRYKKRKDIESSSAISNTTPINPSPSTSEEYYYDAPARRDYSEDWSDYDSWGYDGVLKKRRKKRRDTKDESHLIKIVRRGLGSYLS